MSNNNPQTRGTLFYTVIPLFGYLLLALILTWPTVSHLTTYLPGDGGDDPAIAWNLWWVKQALLTTRQNPFQTDFMFYPLGINLAFYTLTLLNALTALPLTLTLGVVTASNLHMWFSFAAGGYGTFLLVRYVLVTSATANSRLSTAATRKIIWASAAIAGGFYAFAGNKLFYVALGQFNIAGTHWIPFAVLYILRTRHHPTRLKNPMMAGLFLTMQTWTEMTYASFILVFIGLYWLFWLIKGVAAKKPIRSVWPHILAALVMGLVFTAGISPILAQMLPDMMTEGDFFVEGSGFAEAFSADMLGFFIPTMHHPVLGWMIEQTGITAFDKGQHIYIGVALLGLTLIAAFSGYRRHTQLRFWLLAAIAFALLTLGPLIIINGYTTPIPGPFVIFQYLPFFKGNRYPSRYSVMLILSLSVTAAFGLLWIGQWFSRTGHRARNISFFALGIIAAIFLLEHWSAPLPQSNMQTPAPYQIIAADTDNFTVLDIPFAWRNGFRITGALTTQFMFGQFYQTHHQKKMLQGNTSRNPEFKFQYFTQAPVINSLLALETGKTLPPTQWEADRAIAAKALQFFNIKYIVVRPDTTGSQIVTPQATLPYIEDIFPVEKIHNETAIKIYRVNTPSPQLDGTLINSNNPLAPLYFGEGWGLIKPDAPIAAQRKEVRLLLPLTGTTHQITLRMRLPDTAAFGTQTVVIEVNGWRSSPQTMKPEWHNYLFNVPPNAIRPGLNDVRLHFSETAAPPPATSVMDVTVLSAGEEVGGFGHIYINGHNVSPNRRGYNIAVINNPDGSIPAIQTANFDTHLDPNASTALINFLAAAPPDALVAVAAADDASTNLSEAAAQAIQLATGATATLQNCFRCSHAIIGSGNNNPATPPLEAVDALRPVGVSTKMGLTEPGIAAQVEWIQVNAASEKQE